MLTLKLKYANDDRHSGNYSFHPNPTFEVVKIIQTIREYDSNCLIDRFYDDVRQPDAEDLIVLKNMEFSSEKLKDDLGIPFILIRQSS